MTPEEVCHACRRENSPRVDDIAFCSSCVEAGWDIAAYGRGVEDTVKAMALDLRTAVIERLSESVEQSNSDAEVALLARIEQAEEGRPR